MLTMLRHTVFEENAKKPRLCYPRECTRRLTHSTSGCNILAKAITW